MFARCNQKYRQVNATARKHTSFGSVSNVNFGKARICSATRGGGVEPFYIGSDILGAPSAIQVSPIEAAPRHLWARWSPSAIFTRLSPIRLPMPNEGKGAGPTGLAGNWPGPSRP